VSQALYCYRSRLIRRLLLRARDPEALALNNFLAPFRPTVANPEKSNGEVYFQTRSPLYWYRSRLIRRLLLKARDPEALAFNYFWHSSQLRIDQKFFEFS
jgi:hypothetical protein